MVWIVVGNTVKMKAVPVKVRLGVVVSSNKLEGLRGGWGLEQDIVV